MRVLFLAKYYPPVEGGIERYSHMLCSELLKRGVDVEVAAASDGECSGNYEVVDGVKVMRFNAQCVISSTPITLGLPAYLKKNIDNFDLIHLNFPYPWTDAIYLALYQHRKAVMTYHSDIFRPHKSLSGLFLKAYQPCINRVLSKVNAIIATSPNGIQYSPFLSRQQDRCRAIPMPVEQHAFDEPELSVVEELRLEYRDFALFVGRLVYYKGVKYLVEAMEKLDGVNLVIVGKGPLEGELKRQAKIANIEHRVFFEGSVSDERRQALYHACKCFVLPSIAHAEGFGIVLAEAMACGKPVISTELKTGTSYVNLDGISGYVVPPFNAGALANKIKFLIENESVARDMGLRGRERVEKEFTRDRVVSKTIELYDDVLEGRSIAGESS